MKKFFICMLLSSTLPLMAHNFKEIQVSADYAKCINYSDDHLFGASATAFWETKFPFLLGAGAGAYYGYSDQFSMDLYASGKYRLKEYKSIHPFVQFDFGTATLFSFGDYSIMAIPKFGFEFPYLDGKFFGSAGVRYDHLIDYDANPVSLQISFGYVF